MTNEELYPQRDKAFKEHPDAEHGRAQKRTMETKEGQPRNETDKESSKSKNKERNKGNKTAEEHKEPEELESHEVKLEPVDASPQPSGPTPVRRLKRKTNPEDATTPLKKPETKPEIVENKLEHKFEPEKPEEEEIVEKPATTPPKKPEKEEIVEPEGVQCLSDSDCELMGPSLSERLQQDLALAKLW